MRMRDVGRERKMLMMRPWLGQRAWCVRASRAGSCQPCGRLPLSPAVGSRGRNTLSVGGGSSRPDAHPPAAATSEAPRLQGTSTAAHTLDALPCVQGVHQHCHRRGAVHPPHAPVLSGAASLTRAGRGRQG